LRSEREITVKDEEINLLDEEVKDG